MWHVRTYRATYGVRILENKLPRLLNNLAAKNSPSEHDKPTLNSIFSLMSDVLFLYTLTECGKCDVFLHYVFSV